MGTPVRSLFSLTAAVAAVAAFGLCFAPPAAASGWKPSAAINCGWASGLCTEVANSRSVFGYYVGHDEPSVLFYSHEPGSGNHMRYDITLPSDPSPRNPTEVGKSYQFELSGAEWLGMAMCDTQSYPEQVSTCPPDSDKNILDPAVSPDHVGEAYMEMQFYPPGWIPWPTWQVAVGASSCSPTQWCAALNIDSLSLNPVTNETNNQACLNQIGEEPVNFAFITHSGVSTGPANPVDATTTGTYTPSRQDLFMNDGDHLQVSFSDTPDGLRVIIDDLTTGQSGSMTASAANGFGQVKFDPTGSGCTNIPYDFHPMYSTTTRQTRVTWAAGSYNVAFDTEIGHFQFCNGPVPIPATPFGLDAMGSPTVCPTGDTEGEGSSAEPSDPLNLTTGAGDDGFCFPAYEAIYYHVQGCTYTNIGFDGASYQPLWPDGNTVLHPTSFQFSSPTTGPGYDQQYQKVGFETDLPPIESTCNQATGAGCTLIPTQDNGQPAAFYPFYTTSFSRSGRDSAGSPWWGRGGCVFEPGNNIPGEITNFGENAQYGQLLALDYTQPGGSAAYSYQDFRNILHYNPCPQGSGGGGR